MKKSLLSIALLAGALSAPAFAQAPSPAPAAAPGMPPGGVFKDIKREDALRRAAEQFDMVDTNKDGVITGDEMRAAMEKRMKDAGRGRPMGGPAGAPPQR